MPKTRPILYLAAPYSHSDEEVRLLRYHTITAAAARLISDGFVVFSPITMTHPIDQILADQGSTLGSDYWVDFDESFMHFCSEIVVLKLDGWQDSRGVQREIAFFKAHGRPIRYLEPREVSVDCRVPTTKAAAAA
jgi:hypothetical protein